MSGDKFKRENFPTDLGKSFLADWEADKADVQQRAGSGSVPQMQQGEARKIDVSSSEDVEFEVDVQQGGKSTKPQSLGSDDGFNWYPSEDLG
ncbi:MAG: hypothetical protein KDI90_12470 [Alphaproteobacteria bacterium]|nr:hypothetical protein [Alphaproteobacteria bacterium]MCB9975022.1 hypothetical protein [Rhodospirillales bacterium]